MTDPTLKEAEKLKKELKFNTELLRQKKEQVDIAAEKISDLNVEIKELQRTVGRINEHIKEKVSEKEKLLSDKVKEYDSIIAGLKEELADYRKKSNDLDEAVKRFADYKARECKAIEDSKKEVENLFRTVNEHKARNEEDSAKLKAERAKAQEKSEAADIALGEAKRVTEAADKAKEDAGKEKESAKEMRDEASRLLEEAKELKDQADKDMEKNRDAAVAIEDRAKEIYAVRDANQSILDEANRIKEENKNAFVEIKVARKKNQDEIERLREVERELARRLSTIEEREKLFNQSIK